MKCYVYTVDITLDQIFIQFLLDPNVYTAQFYDEHRVENIRHTVKISSSSTNLRPSLKHVLSPRKGKMTHLKCLFY